MPTDTTLYSTRTIDTHPLRLHEGAVVGVGSRWARQAMSEIAALEADLAKRDDLIAHYKIGEAGWIEESKKHESAVAKLSEANSRQCDTITEQTKRDEYLNGVIKTQKAESAKLRGQVSGFHEQIDLMRAQEFDLRGTIASLRTQLARATAIEKAAKEFHGKFPVDNLYFGHVVAAWHRLKDALASPIPSVTPDGERAAESRLSAAIEEVLYSWSHIDSEQRMMPAIIELRDAWEAD